MVVSCNHRIVADKVSITRSFFTRFIGLMGKKKLGAGEGLLLINCSAIHCFFMKMTIDAVYLSNDMTVLDIETLTPWSIGRRVKHAAHVLELSPNTAQFSAGDVLQLFENKRSSAKEREKCNARTNK